MGHRWGVPTDGRRPLETTQFLLRNQKHSKTESGYIDLNGGYWFELTIDCHFRTNSQQLYKSDGKGDQCNIGWEAKQYIHLWIGRKILMKYENWINLKSIIFSIFSTTSKSQPFWTLWAILSPNILRSPQRWSWNCIKSVTNMWSEVCMWTRPSSGRSLPSSWTWPSAKEQVI